MMLDRLVEIRFGGAGDRAGFVGRHCGRLGNCTWRKHSLYIIKINSESDIWLTVTVTVTTSPVLVVSSQSVVLQRGEQGEFFFCHSYARPGVLSGTLS